MPNIAKIIPIGQKALLDFYYKLDLLTIALNTAHRLLESGNPHKVTASDLGLGKVKNWETTVTGTTATLPGIPMSWFDPQVFVNGLLQGSSQYIIIDDKITFLNALFEDDVQIIYSEETP